MRVEKRGRTTCSIDPRRDSAGCSPRSSARFVEIHRGDAALRQALTDELAKVRIEMHDGDAALRQALTDELAKVRAEVHQVDTGLRQEVHQVDAGLRQEMAGVRQDMIQFEAGLRQEMAAQTGTLRQQMAATRVDIIRWSFLFWLGQVVAIAGLLSFMLRGLTP
ncbi:MAG: DUF1640 domain-containing protein [Luteitalea sp.]|nr:DUF1640 domain-containing protein [Luteitalea sp.]